MGVRDRKERSKGWMKGLAQCSWGGGYDAPGCA